MNILTRYTCFITIYFFVVHAAFGQKRIQPVSLDTSCLTSGYPAFGIQNLQKGHFEYIIRGQEEEMDTDENKLKLFAIDTVPVADFKRYKAKYTSQLNSDSGLVSWTDTSLVINHNHYIADKRDYSEFNYYLGYIEPLQLYCVSYINGKNEIGLLTLEDQVTGKIFYLESSSDYPLTTPDVSPDITLFSAYVNDLYDYYSFISFFKINKSGSKFCLEDYSGLKFPNSRIDDFVWLGSSIFAILITEINQNNETGIQNCLKITIQVSGR